MKKGIIMEQHENYAVFITREGAFEKGSYNFDNAEVGQEVFYEPLVDNKRSIFQISGERKKSFLPRTLSIALILLLILVPIYVIPGKNEVYAYVTVDINPSISLEVNEAFHVRAIHAANQDALTIIEQITDYKNEELEILIDQIMAKSEETGLINEDKNILIGISYVGNDGSNNLTELKHLEQYLLQNEADWNIATFHVPKDIRKLADKENISMNEKMAEELDEMAIDKSDLENNPFLNEDEKAIITSFYDDEEVDVTTNEAESDKSKSDPVVESLEVEESPVDDESEELIILPKKNNAPSAKEKNKQEKESMHPSELKAKNGEINSKGKNIENKKAEKKNNGSQSSRNSQGKSNSNRSKDVNDKDDSKGQKVEKEKHHNHHNGKDKSNDDNEKKNKSNNGKGHGNKQGNNGKDNGRN